MKHRLIKKLRQLVGQKQVMRLTISNECPDPPVPMTPEELKDTGWLEWEEYKQEILETGE